MWRWVCLWWVGDSAIRKLRHFSHRPGHERVLAAVVADWMAQERLSATIVFPGCGSGAYELAFLLRLRARHAFNTVVMMDREVLDADIAVWGSVVRGLDAELVVLRSFAELTTHLTEVASSYEVVFFHRASGVDRDPGFAGFVGLCTQRAGAPYVNAFHREGRACVFAAPWASLLRGESSCGAGSGSRQHTSTMPL
jgi:hypothetical protein